MNKITIIGNLTADPELRSTQNGKSVCGFTVAVDRRFPGSDGEKVTDFFRVNAWGAQGESCSKHLAKGRKVAVLGELQARTYSNKDGATKLSLDVKADEIEFLSPRENKGENKGFDLGSFSDISDDDIPFN